MTPIAVFVASVVFVVTGLVCALISRGTYISDLESSIARLKVEVSKASSKSDAEEHDRWIVQERLDATRAREDALKRGLESMRSEFYVARLILRVVYGVSEEA